LIFLTEEIVAPAAIQLYGEYSSIFKEEGKWTQGIYKLPDNTTWTYNEPDAVIIVKRNSLQVRIEHLTRSHDTIQLLDNTKHLYLSTAKFPTPEDGTISFEIEMNAKVAGAKNNDLYNGFTAFNLHDLEGGFGLSFLTNGTEYATLYSRQTPSGITSRNPTYPRFFEIYNERPLTPLPEGKHRFTINYTKKKEYAEWLLDGERVNYQDRIPDPITAFNLSLGIMTAVDLGPNGSQSLHGQGITGEWSIAKITSQEHSP
jgi:uncharacterized protein DUF6081